MSFYGKIYEQLGDVFNRLTFKGKAPAKSEEVPQGKAENITLNAETSGDNLSLTAGNSWITFKGATGDNECKIYHSAPNATVVDNNPIIEYVGTGVLGTLDGEIKFGDTIVISTPVFDQAGHLTNYQRQIYKLAQIPALPDIEQTMEDVATMQGDISTLQNDLTGLSTTVDDFSTRIGTAEDNAETALDNSKTNQTAISKLNVAVQKNESRFGKWSDIGTTQNADNMTVSSVIGNLNNVLIDKDDLADILGNLGKYFTDADSFAEVINTIYSSVQKLNGDITLLTTMVNIINDYLGIGTTE